MLQCPRLPESYISMKIFNYVMWISIPLCNTFIMLSLILLR
jgi:hypothetical protein